MSNETVFQSLWDTPANDRGFLSFDARTNTVNLHGMQTGKVTALSSRFNAVLGGHVVVLHEAGSSYFVGRGIQGYAAAEHRTVLVEARSATGGETYRYVTLSNAAEVKGNDASRSLSTQLVAEHLQKETTQS